MLRAGDVLDMTPIGAVFRIKKTGAETDGRSFEMEWELAPETGGTPVHIHPHALESYEVLAGELDVFIDRTWRRLTGGEKIVVDPGVPHTFRNAGRAAARVHNVHEPAMKFDEYFEGLHRIVNSGAIRQGKVTPKALLHLSVLMASFKDEIRSVRPPDTVIRILAMFGRLVGYRA
jgi:mannose-6-phosphate isomerase-like protein (cupin superfamily)